MNDNKWDEINAERYALTEKEFQGVLSDGEKSRLALLRMAVKMRHHQGPLSVSTIIDSFEKHIREST